MKMFKIFIASCFIGAAIILIVACRKVGYVCSSGQHAFKLTDFVAQRNGLEYCSTDIHRCRRTGDKTNILKSFCKFGNMVAVNVIQIEEPWLRKMENKVVVLTGKEGDLPFRAQEGVLIVVMDADVGEMCVTKPTRRDVVAFRDANLVEVRDRVVYCHEANGFCHEIPTRVMYRMNFFERMLNRIVIIVAAVRGRHREDVGRIWRDPESGLRWNYVETKDGVEIVNKKTGGCAVSPMPIGSLEFPEFVNDKPVKSIGSGAIVNGLIEKVIIPSTVERFEEKAPYSLDNMNLKFVEVKDGNMVYRSIDGALYDITGKVLLFVPRNMTDIRIAEGVTNIADCAFHGCDSIRSVTLPSSVVSLGNNVFFMSNITEVRFLGDAPVVTEDRLDGIYSMTPETLTTYATKRAKGWRVNGDLPTTWCDRPIVFE